jgi:hypothetical protein
MERATLWAQQHYKIKNFSMGDIILWFPKSKRDTPESSKNGGLVHTKYNIAFIIILYFLLTLTSLNQTILVNVSTS